MSEGRSEICMKQEGLRKDKTVNSAMMLYPASESPISAMVSLVSLKWGDSVWSHRRSATPDFRELVGRLHICGLGPACAATLNSIMQLLPSATSDVARPNCKK